MKTILKIEGDEHCYCSPSIKVTYRNPNLGKKAKDKITGFEGVITGFCQYITGCDQYCLMPDKTKDNVYPTGHYFDVNRLEIEKEVAVRLEVETVQGSMESPAVK